MDGHGPAAARVLPGRGLWRASGGHAPAPPTQCPHCGYVGATVCAVAGALREVTVGLCCPACGREWCELRLPALTTRYYTEGAA